MYSYCCINNSFRTPPFSPSPPASRISRVKTKYALRHNDNPLPRSPNNEACIHPRLQQSDTSHLVARPSAGVHTSLRPRSGRKQNQKTISQRVIFAPPQEGLVASLVSYMQKMLHGPFSGPRHGWYHKYERCCKTRNARSFLPSFLPSFVPIHRGVNLSTFPVDLPTCRR